MRWTIFWWMNLLRNWWRGPKPCDSSEASTLNPIRIGAESCWNSLVWMDLHITWITMSYIISKSHIMGNICFFISFLCRSPYVQHSWCISRPWLLLHYLSPFPRRLEIKGLDCDWSSFQRIYNLHFVFRYLSMCNRASINAQQITSISRLVYCRYTAIRHASNVWWCANNCETNFHSIRFIHII